MYTSKSSLFRSVVYDVYCLYPTETYDFYLDLINSSSGSLFGRFITKRDLKTVSYWLSRNGYFRYNRLNRGGVIYVDKICLQQKNF